MAFGVGLMTPVPYPIAYALIGGLSADSVVKHPEALQVFPEVQLIDFDSAARDALERTHPSHIERVWEDGRQAFKFIKHGGCFLDHREMQVDAAPANVLAALNQFVHRSNAFNKVVQTKEQILVCLKDQAAGKKWIEWRIGHEADVTYLKQTVFFCPNGLPGFLYWYLLYPFHLFNFHAQLQKIVIKAKQLTTETQKHGEGF
jgi:hypothetical protein